MKKNHIFVLLITFAILFIISGCDLKDENPTNPDPEKTVYDVSIVGEVVEAVTGNPIAQATIIITDNVTVKGTTTNEEGKYSTTFQVEKDQELKVIAKKDGFLNDTSSVFVMKDVANSVPLFQLQKDANSTGGTTSGGAASIYLYSQSATSIGVKESGSLESADIVFEVRDSSGNVIDASKAVDVYFTFGSAPGGGEYLFPAFSKTNALGKATVTLNTGTVAGVVQVVAQASYDGKTIRSKPILIAIHGGFPDLGHFHVASPKLNYPALGIIGFSIDFTAYVGDKYSNPVRENTVVYFKTNSGIIVGSALTGSLGTGTVSLLTQPWPDDPVYGPGFFTVTATTVNEFSESISTETVRLQSGGPILSVSPTSFNINNGGSQSFTFTLNDVNGNPMAEGQSADVKIESEFYKVAGSTSVKLPDTQSKSWTVFSFTAYDNKPDSVFVENISIEISTGGPNGSTKIAVSGVGR